MKKNKIMPTPENITINEELAKYNDNSKKWFVGNTQEKANEILAKSKTSLESFLKKL